MSSLTSSQFKALFDQTLPMLVGLLAIMGSQLIDSAFIGQLGDEPLVIVGFSIPIYQLIVGVQVGIGIAATACMSTAIGENKIRYARFLSAIILTMGSVLLMLLCGLLWFFQQEVVTALGGDASIFNQLRNYWLPWLISCWLGAILYFGYSISRAFGDTNIPGNVMVITSIINIVLDPIFIFTFDMGMSGAAWASCVAFAIGLIIIFNSIKDKHFIALPTKLNVIKMGVSSISKFTAPAMVSQFIPPVSAIVVTALVATFGHAAIASWGLASRVEYLLIILILAMTMALPPMIGKLKGQKNYTEINALVKTAVSVILGFQLLLALLFILAAEPVSALLTTDDGISALLSQYLALVPISYGALGVCMICVSASNAIGLPSFALAISLIRLLACYLPLVWLGAEFHGFYGVLIGATVGNFLAGFTSWQLFKRQLAKVAKTNESFKLSVAQ
ncbi:MATE family efflux transporter [Shewanella sp. 10N.7]|uniref:MATE family efflux transporter n=1 Tax=Shewanella sp. 10N.7 TaxID=2885093 RepID=UPI001E4AD87A|nr:MATE family efflux transporter [Shewanella sp. 10N.7]MCC4832745.1 MATE family efflux transporter [Shewanella sp. 10N.7]